MRDIDRSSAEATLIPPGGIATKQIRSVEFRLQVPDYRAFIARLSRVLEGPLLSIKRETPVIAGFCVC